MRRQIVQPAILCIMGTLPNFVLGPLVLNAYIVPSSVEPRPLGDAIVLFSSIGVGLWLLLFSLLLFFDGVRQPEWGILDAIFFGLLSPISMIGLAYVLTGSTLAGVSSYILILYLSGPPLGLAGALWGLAWLRALPVKQSTTQSR
jgi:hypothetical protein